jgi:sec-independent protein translocase protein TatC
VNVELAMAVVWELPLFIIGLTRLGIIKTSQLRKNRRLGYFITACVAVALPGVDPVTVFFEVLPLLILFECSIWVSVLLDRRSNRLKTAALET